MVGTRRPVVTGHTEWWRRSAPPTDAWQSIPEASRRRLDDTVERLRALLPDDWNVTVAHRQSDRGIISITADDGTEATVSVVTRDRLEPRDIGRLTLPKGPTMLFAKWLSPRSRELLRGSKIGFLDQTGNVRFGFVGRRCMCAPRDHRTIRTRSRSVGQRCMAHESGH